MINSTDEGVTWSRPVRVNQDPAGQGKQQFFPWIACDPETGALCVIFYDDRNVSATECEVFVAVSLDGGDTWEDFKVSDVAFTPEPISVRSYFGDYFGIAVQAGRMYPCWTDNRSGSTLASTFISPFTLVTTSVQDQAAGRQAIGCDGRNHHGAELGTGVYVCRIRTGNLEKTIKMVLIK